MNKDIIMKNEIEDTTIEEFVQQGVVAERTWHGLPIINIFNYAYTASKNEYTFEPIHDYRFYSTNPSYEHSEYLPPILALDDVYGTLLINADSQIDTGNRDVDIPKEFFNLPVVSFLCMAKITNIIDINARKLEEKHIITLAKNIKMVDYVPQEIKELSAKERGISSARLPKYNGDYTIEYQNGKRVWHKPSKCLFKCNNTYYVMGRDEGTYFACELPPVTGYYMNVKHGFDALVPSEAKGKKGVIRQGEWFAIPVREQEVPKIGPDIIFNSFLPLPIEDTQSNIHSLETNNMFHIRVKDGVFYAKNWSLEHDDHDFIEGKTGIWYKFARNTAIRSVSQEGVD